ncbi:hypothetical protein SAMN05661010_02925 [Modicisalibacter muralis]|uniref:DUF192 domain-containing protein n=1 Tax=Modicisalibacter muralis TaxID=119000 RepID=A0A1G9P749_9GAMM|nr:DUF192 domain-containing protein [Halomonas muralis]SDL94057.1 hypothetical protein SAMN05661010_02925 [Halomonas muralis]
MHRGNTRRAWRRPLLAGVIGVGGLIGMAWALERTTVAVIGAETTHWLQVEIADDAGERAYGLMERDSLPADAGMLFVYQREQSPQASFWMYQTRIPLDIAFLGGDGEIRAIRTMPPCTSEDAAECPSYPAGVPYRVALEVNADYFAEHDIDVGDCITLPGARGTCSR